MTLLERYNDLSTPLNMFGKTHPAPLKEVSIESLQAYAEKCIKSNFPMLKSVGFEINRNLCNSGYNLNGTI